MSKLDRFIIIICALGFSLCVAGILRGADEPKPPAITSELREGYFQARGDVLEAQISLDAAQKRLEAAVKAMQAICPLTVDAQGKPQCAPKPEGSQQ